MRLRAFLLAGLPVSARVTAQDLMLTEACEEDFRRLIRMAQEGRLGDDVTNANVGVEYVRVRVELVRAGAPSKVLWLTPKRSRQKLARFFDLSAGERASESDLVRVGSALDEIFAYDPFTLAGLEASPGGAPIPGFAEAWAHGGWKGILRAFERRMMALAGIEYTVAVIVLLALALLGDLLLLWTAAPPPRR
jgi:hypothetical protein